MQKSFEKFTDFLILYYKYGKWLDLPKTLQDSDDYRALKRQYDQLIQQLDAAQQETRTHRENADKSRMEVFMLRSQLDSGAAAVRFELENARGENERLKQLIDALRNELESTKKENAEV